MSKLRLQVLYQKSVYLRFLKSGDLKLISFINRAFGDISKNILTKPKDNYNFSFLYSSCYSTSGSFCERWNVVSGSDLEMLLYTYWAPFIEKALLHWIDFTPLSKIRWLYSFSLFQSCLFHFNGICAHSLNNATLYWLLQI